MKKLYCPECDSYLEGGDGELKDCFICNWKQPREEEVKSTKLKKLYCPKCDSYLEGGDGELKDCFCGWKQPD